MVAGALFWFGEDCASCAEEELPVLGCGCCDISAANTPATSSAAAMSAVFRRLFIVLKPNFVLPLSARAISATHPSQRLAASYRAQRPRVIFLAGHLSQRKVYMRSIKKVVTQGTAPLVVCTRDVLLALAV